MELARADTQTRYHAAIEAILLVATEPLALEHIATVLSRVAGQTVERAEVEQGLAALKEGYETRGSGLALQEWSGGYRLTTHPDVAAYVEAARVQEKPVRLSGAVVETLAVVAYRQPVTKPEVDFVRGVDSGYTIGRLTELGLVSVTGRSDGPGKPLLYGTTPLFLESFGLTDLSGLPTLREMEELLGDPAFSREKARLLLLQDEVTASPDESAPPSDEAQTPEA